jgi:hypothetical protein
MQATGPRIWVRRRVEVAFSFGLLVLGACAPTTVEPQQDYSGSALPRPDRVIVYNFAVSPDEVELDQGLSAELVRSLQSASTTEQERMAGQQVARAIAGTLVGEIINTGLYAEPAQESPPFPDNVVLIKGQILSIDEGNRTLRTLIGLGAGGTAVEADAQVLYLAQGTTTPRLIENMQAAARSDRLPGVGETLFPGELLINLVTGAAGAAADETFGANVEADGKRMGRQVADNVAPVFAGQGWIAYPH